MKILTRFEVHEIDRELAQAAGDPNSIFGEVGSRLADWFEKNVDASARLLIVIGPGNNGRDGEGLALELMDRGFSVHIMRGSRKPLPLSPKLQNREIEAFDDQFDVVVDALFGIGLKRELEKSDANLIGELNSSQAVRVAIDIPSGVDCDSGEVSATHFQADHTLAIAAAKPGHFLLPGVSATGKLHIIDVDSLSLPTRQLKAFWQPLKGFSQWQNRIKPALSSHKFNRGQVSFTLCQRFPGAALLAAQAAQSAGAGYVKIFCPTALTDFCQVTYPQFVFETYESAKDLQQLLELDPSDSFVLGPGWDLQEFDLSTLLKKEAQFVFDGGLLTPATLTTLRDSRRANYTLTPHAGELRRMLGDSQNKSKLEQVTLLIEQIEGTVVAKGFDTIVANRKERHLATWNSASLATAGSGDILSGILGSFLAKGLSPFEASCAAVALHRLSASSAPVSLPPRELIRRLLIHINTFDPSLESI